MFVVFVILLLCVAGSVYLVFGGFDVVGDVTWFLIWSCCGMFYWLFVVWFVGGMLFVIAFSLVLVLVVLCFGFVGCVGFRFGCFVYLVYLVCSLCLCFGFLVAVIMLECYFVCLVGCLLMWFDVFLY